jgi:membrane protease YdiL (CAAX protease family)
VADESRLQAVDGHSPAPLRLIGEALGAAVIVTAAVTVESIVLPDKHVATAVAFTFLIATWALVWRKDDAFVRHCGLAFGDVVMPGSRDIKAILEEAARALAWAFTVAVVLFVPFYLGWRVWWRPHLSFHLAWTGGQLVDEAVGQLLLIALPEEAFYRGYLQTRLDDALPFRVNVIGAKVGVGLVLASAVFALGHVATIRDAARLAVFFPSLVFGWLRVRTGGVGASVVFHAACNLFSLALGRGYGLY